MRGSDCNSATIVLCHMLCNQYKAKIDNNNATLFITLMFMTTVTLTITSSSKVAFLHSTLIVISKLGWAPVGLILAHWAKNFGHTVAENAH